MTPLIGHERTLRTLWSAMATGRMHHAWVFHGPHGVGKFTTALHLARILLCSSPGRDADGAFGPCETCESCRLISKGEESAHPDLHVIRKELARFSGTRTVVEDDIDDDDHDGSEKKSNRNKFTTVSVGILREWMVGGYVNGKYYEPTIGRRAVLGHGKVFIIDEAELLAPVGQNLLLKTLEEPPPGVTIILVTSRESQLISTVRSRCQRLGFGPLAHEQVAAWLAQRPETPALDDGERELIVRFAAGSPGRAALALKYGLHHWLSNMEETLRELARGRADPNWGVRMAEMVEHYAKTVADEDDRNSKAAANDNAVRVMLSILAELTRRGIGHIAGKVDPAGDGSSAVEAEQRLAPWLAGADQIDAAERYLESNVAPALLLDNLAVQWTAAVARGR